MVIHIAHETQDQSRLICVISEGNKVILLILSTSLEELFLELVG